MAFVAANPSSYAGKVVGTGQCVAFVQQAAGAGEASSWSPGIPVKGASFTDIAPGTAIATFINGRYPDLPTGNHAAIYLSHDTNGIWVWDQWSTRAVDQRKIFYKAGDSDPSNDGDFFHVIE